MGLTVTHTTDRLQGLQHQVWDVWEDVVAQLLEKSSIFCVSFFMFLSSLFILLGTRAGLV